MAECLCHLDAGWPWETGERHAFGKLGVCEVDGKGMESRAALGWMGRCVWSSKDAGDRHAGAVRGYVKAELSV